MRLLRAGDGSVADGKKGFARMSAAVTSSSSSEADRKGGHRRVRSPIVPARAGDHESIYRFLATLFPGPMLAEFKASLADPFYEPRDRLLLKRAGALVAHVHLTRRVMQFGPNQIPVAGLKWLATAPHCRYQGLASHLLSAAERQAIQEGALVGLLRTRIPHFFRRAGWALCGQPSLSQANTRTVLARLLDEGLRRHRRGHPRLHIRPWRRWEEKAVVRIYRQNLPGRYGPFDRTLAYWQWLLRRQAYDQIYVALDGPDLWDLEEVSTPAVGYVVLKGHRVIELMTAPGRPRVAAELLAHACGDAIEHDHHSIVLHAPPDSPFHHILAPSEGPPAGERAVVPAFHGCGPPGRCEQDPERGEVWMARLLQPKLLLERLCGEFCLRARQARLARPLELGLQVEGQKYQLELSNCGAAVTCQRMGRSYLRMNVADFTRLLLGQLDWDRAVADKRLEASTALAQEIGRVLFPRLPLWYPPLDELTP
jgi:predicted N-acetyltransferase YhbS